MIDVWICTDKHFFNFVKTIENLVKNFHNFQEYSTKTMLHVCCTFVEQFKNNAIAYNYFLCFSRCMLRWVRRASAEHDRLGVHVQLRHRRRVHCLRHRLEHGPRVLDRHVGVCVRAQRLLGRAGQRRHQLDGGRQCRQLFRWETEK